MKHKLFFSLLLFLPLCSCHLSNVYQAQAITEDENHEVEIGETINVGPRTLTYNSEKKTVQGQIIFPDGSSKSGKSFTITMPGVYTVKYQAVFGVEEVSESIYYTCLRRSGDLFLTSNENNKPSTGEYSFNNKKGSTQGAKLKLDSKTVFTFDGVIDFNTFNANEPFIEFMVDTAKQGESDLESFTIRLTDADDSANYIELLITDSGPIDDDGRGCYIRAGAYNQFKTGYEGKRLHTQNYGTNVGSSFRALPSNNPVNPAQIYLNYPEKALYVYPICNSMTKDIITDLDDKGLYGSVVWEGFKNGKAILSIFGNSIISASADIIISKAGNLDLSQMIFKDETKPTINVDFGNQLPGDVPNAQVDKPYNIFLASVTDNFDKDLSYTASVTYQDTENAKTKDISIVNNTFTPKKAGTYRITYRAKDHSNNETIKNVNVIAVDKLDKMAISLATTEISENVYSKILLPSVDEAVVTGGSGKSTVTRILKNSNKEVVDVEGDTFIPTEIGEYIAYYIAADYLGNKATCSVKITVTKPDKPIFIGDLVLPRVLIKGHTYSLPTYTAVEVVNDKTVLLDPEIYVNNEKLASNEFTAGDTCDVTYKVKGQTGENEYKTSVNVIKMGSTLDICKYFYGGFNKVENKDNVTLTSSVDANALFASVLPYDNPYIKFSVDKEAMYYDELLFKFSDSLDPSVSLSFHVTFSGKDAFVAIGNDSTQYDFSQEEKNGNHNCSIDFNNSSRVLSDVNHKEIVKVKYDDAGQPFNGFAHGVYLEISMLGVENTSSIKVLNIANQMTGHADIHEDFSSPIIIFNNKFVNEQDYNADAYFPTVEAFDVLGNAPVTVSAVDPNGETVLPKQDARVPHTFKLSSFGTYLVTYQSIDDTGNVTTLRRNITVYDFVPPEITVNYNLKATYSINAKITIPTYTVKDNLNDYTLDVFLILPSEEVRLLLMDKNGTVTSYLDKENSIYNASFKVKSNVFRAEQYGRYTLRYVAYDFDFNKTVQEFYFEVK